MKVNKNNRYSYDIKKNNSTSLLIKIGFRFGLYPFGVEKRLPLIATAPFYRATTILAEHCCYPVCNHPCGKLFFRKGVLQKCTFSVRCSFTPFNFYRR